MNYKSINLKEDCCKNDCFIYFICEQVLTNILKNDKPLVLFLNILVLYGTCLMKNICQTANIFIKHLFITNH